MHIIMCYLFFTFYFLFFSKIYEEFKAFVDAWYILHIPQI
jgi:hypothetical protein